MKDRLSTMRARALVAGVLLLPPLAWAAEAESPFRADLDVTMAWVDNIALSPTEPLKQDVVTTEVGLELGYKLMQERSVEVEASVRPFYQYVSDLDRLSNYGASVNLDLRGEFGPDFTAPWYALGVEYTLIQFDDSDPRDGQWIEIEAVLGKQFSPKLELRGGYRYFQRWQSDSSPECPPAIDPGCLPQFNWKIDDVFNHTRNGLFAQVDVYPVEGTNVFLQYSYWNGDVAAAGAPARPNEPVVTDLALGTYSGPGLGWYRIWRADADQHVAELGVKHQFNEHFNVEGSLLYLWTTDVDSAISDEDYENTILRLTLGYSF